MDHEEFEKLKPEEQERIFHKTPFRERGELLLHAHNPVYLTQTLSQEELYLLTRELDLEERSEILRYASLPQLFFISDIDCWKKDRLHTKSFVQWLETLIEADEQKLLAWLVEMDYETVVSGFKNLIRVLKPEWEYPSDELLGDESFFTLDERYFISVKEENIETVRRAIEILYENYRGRYAAILEGVLSELDYEMEEEAFQKRGVRLAERGFPDFETAHLIYRPISREDFERFSKKNQVREKREKDSNGNHAAHYLDLWSNDRLFLDEVLLLFREESDEVREGIEEELAWLSNKVIACEGIDFASEERVRQGVDRARCMVSIGLEALSDRDTACAKEILEERWLEIIFRWGVSQITSLREEAVRVIESNWRGNRKDFIEFLGPPYNSIFQGLFRSLPECYDAEIRENPDSLRDFKDNQDVERIGQAVRQIKKAFQFLRERFPQGFNSHHEATLFSLLGATFASATVKGKASVEPLTPSETSSFLKKGFESRGSRRVITNETKEKFLRRFFPAAEQKLLKPLWALVFQRLEEELGGLDPARPVDARFVSSLLVAENK